MDGASAIQMVCPSHSNADTQPQLQPALLRLSAIISQCFTAIAQLVTHIHDVIGTTMPTIKGFVIGGDFNTNHDQAMFAADRTLDSLADAGYQNGFEGLPLSERVTHPGSHGFPDATFDFIFAKGLTASQPIMTQTNASDHWPVTRRFALH
jgi:endonuclease/exonuclease/phosphatase family metal-dependent hydrolase